MSAVTRDHWTPPNENGTYGIRTLDSASVYDSWVLTRLDSAGVCALSLTRPFVRKPYSLRSVVVCLIGLGCVGGYAV